MVDKKYISIAAQLREEIDRGVYKVGENIPPIRKLAETFQVNPQTINKATAYLASLGYLEARRGAGSTVCKPNATGLRPKVPMLVDRFRARLLDDLNDVANFHGKDIYLSYLMEMTKLNMQSSFIVYDRTEQEVPKTFAEEIAGVQGVVVQGTLPPGRIAALAEMNIPTVLINRTNPPGDGRFASVLIPIKHLTDTANYLASLGHKRFLYALSNRFERSPIFDERMAAFKSALSAWDLGEDALEVFFFDESSAKDADELAKAVSNGRSAVVAYNDISAIGIYSLASRIGLSIPRDLSVVGFDDIALAQIASPPLTTVHVDRQHLVRCAFELLGTLLASSAPCRLEMEVPTELVIRQSAFRLP